MIKIVKLSDLLRKKLERRLLPFYLVEKLNHWIVTVEELGLLDTRKIPGYHDEPLQGSLIGYRSIRLNRSWRAYYRVCSEEIEFVYIERIDKHVY